VPDVFISYSRKDSDHALQLADRLRSFGLDIWIDQQGVGLASSWSKQIVEAIESSKAFLILLSPSSTASQQVARELSLAFESKLPLLPLELEPTTLPSDFKYPLSGVQRTSSDDIEAILSSLERLNIYQRPAVHTLPPTPPDPLGRKTIAVLPIENLQPTEENAWFADGLTQELINTLSRVERLRVKDRKSVKSYNTSGKSAQQMADELGVRYLLEGTVRSIGERFRFSVELIDAVEDDHLWSKTFNGAFEDMFEVQEKLANEVADALKITLTLEEREHVGRTLTKNFRAYELYVQARDAVVDFSKEFYTKAEALLRQAVSLDPNFGEAWALLASVHLDLFTLLKRDRKLLELGQQEAETALRLDSRSALATVLLGIVAGFQNRRRDAYRLAHDAVRMDQTDAMIELWRAYVYVLLNDIDRAIEVAEHAYRLSPDNLKIIWGLAYYMILDNDPRNLRIHAERSLPYLERHLALNPDDHTIRAEYALFISIVGRVDEGYAIAKEILEQHYVSKNPLRVMGIATAFYLAEDIERSIEAWRRSEELGSALFTVLSPYFRRLQRHPEFVHIARRFRNDAEIQLLDTEKEHPAQLLKPKKTVRN
jgi:TolB-like protein/Flp pilus assembly protein TadD